MSVARFACLGHHATGFLVHAHDLPEGWGIDGLIGLSFLRQFNYEIRSLKGRIIVDRATADRISCRLTSRIPRRSLHWRRLWWWPIYVFMDGSCEVRCGVRGLRASRRRRSARAREAPTVDIPSSQRASRHTARGPPSSTPRCTWRCSIDECGCSKLDGFARFSVFLRRFGANSRAGDLNNRAEDLVRWLHV